ncbi:glycerophosphodiester phosphodiesterase [Peribacillus butanolivorans]|uniref:glycerophosphodiester phosphodiesterase n=1 Tax=Peribacillus butanolivorans TaxID=421767 RepID=UPI0006A6A4B6|nr:glycerophosphodiester phosphodiesterase [Peribacillus butanolivorans]
MKNIQIFAHRGSKGTHPENTMAAFKEAARIGAEGIEFDVHLSSDGEMIVIHDETLDRTTSLLGYVKDCSAQKLKTADAGSKFSKEFLGERIPFLMEVFDWARGNSLLMNIEIKTDKLAYEGIEQKIIDLIRKYRMEDRVILSSFNHQSIEKVKMLAPELERALLFEGIPENFEEILHDKKESGFHPDKNSLTPAISEKAKKLGYKIRPWVANNKADIIRLAEMDVDVIMTDFPEKAIKILKAWQTSD